MITFEYVLILLAAILFSNLINRFLPSISVPIIQIILGACIALLPIGFQFILDPSLFFVLFLAPLVFDSSMMLNKKALWTLRKPIINLAFALVFVTVISVGYFVHFLIPTIPLSIAFILVAALAPTDTVAVSSVAKRINVPPNIMNILEGESIINDASGLICFQFALAAMLTGSFSLAKASGEFLIVAIGGILLGLLFTLIKLLLVKWIRSLGMENVTFHILIEILTPFLLYLLAGVCSVSGILAVFASGIMHSVAKLHLNPETVNLRIASDSVWSVLSFTLDGLVFLILGTQLPNILHTLQFNSPINIWKTIAYILAITFVLVLSRYIWSFLTIRKSNYIDEDTNISKSKACLIFSLSGARGAVTLASIMSIPIYLNDGSPFPDRNLIILIATGVILCTLLITNFVLPLLLENKRETINKATENQAYIEILRHVIAQLNNQITPENKHATEVVTREYHSRSLALQNKQNINSFRSEAERELKIMAFTWEKQNTEELLARKQIDDYPAQRYLDILDMEIERNSRKNIKPLTSRQKRRLQVRYLLKMKWQDKGNLQRQQFLTLKMTNDEFVLEKFREMNETEHDPLIDKMISDYELSLWLQKSRSGGLNQAFPHKWAASKESDSTVNVEDIVLFAFQLERDYIQTMFENGRISRESAKEMRKNISLLELQLRDEENSIF